MSTEHALSGSAASLGEAPSARLRLEPMLERLPAAAYLCDAEGLITYFNSRAAALWGREPRLRHPDDRFCGSFKLFDAEGRPVARSECWVALALREGRDFNGKEISIERPGGERRSALAFANPTYDEQGRISGAINVLLDVSEQRDDSREARESRDTLRLLIDASPAAIVVIDPEPAFVRFWNPAAERLFGWSAEEVLGAPLPVVPDDKLIEFASFRSLVARGEALRDVETQRVTKAGRRVEVSVSAAPLRDDVGTVTSVLLLFVDVTERKRAEQSLKEADHAKNEFLATLAHELRNPLSPIRNAAEILRLRGDSSPELQWALDVIERQMQHMTHLVDDLLDISRITMNRIELRTQSVEVGSILADAVEACKPMLDECEHRLSVTVEPGIVIDGDRERLAQVVANLLHNAAKYTARGGSIQLSGARDGDWVVIDVRDSGIGIPADQLTSIFEMFTQLNPTLERVHGGLGIGLTLAKRLVQMHGGTVEARSGGEGRGSEFTVRLPLPEPATRDERATVARRAVPRTSLRVLVVDDKQDSANSLALLLEMTGNEVRIANDGIAAVRAAADFRPHAAVLDIGMPRMNGYDAARAIRREAWGREIYLIALTGWGQEVDRMRSREAGFDQHFVKPVAPSEILDRLAWLERSLHLGPAAAAVEN